jgi:hypothetical protein
VARNERLIAVAANASKIAERLLVPRLFLIREDSGFVLYRSLLDDPYRRLEGGLIVGLNQRQADQRDQREPRTESKDRAQVRINVAHRLPTTRTKRLASAVRRNTPSLLNVARLPLG